MISSLSFHLFFLDKEHFKLDIERYFKEGQGRREECGLTTTSLTKPKPLIAAHFS